MQRFIRIIKGLYWLGLIGVLGILFDINSLKLFSLFFLLAFIDFILSFILVSKQDSEAISSLKFLFQNLGMLIGIPIIYLRNFFSLPNIKNYSPQNTYMLPFHGKWLTVNGGVDKEHSHSWNICNQRYAYDFYIQKNDSSYSNTGNSVSDYYCYGKEILAPANGIIVEIKNLFQDTPVNPGHEINCISSDVRGNYIVIKHSKGEYSTIAHIKKDSFLVKTGDYVKQGTVIALCGNSGNTSEPHIHFQIQQSKSFLFSAGLPIYFSNIINHTQKEEIHYITAGQFVENKESSMIQL